MAGATSTVTWQLCNAGTLSVLPSFNVGADADLAQVKGELGGVLDERGELACPCNVLVIRADGRLVLVDTGAGPYFGGAGSAVLVDALAAAGATAENVDLVVLSHGHPDHVGGAMTPLGPSYARARHVMSRLEYEYWSQRSEPATFFVEQV